MFHFKKKNTPLPLPAEKEKKGYVYAITTNDNKYVKIGYSGENPTKTRVKSLQISNPQPLTVHSYIAGGPTTERILHKKFIKYRKCGEWFDAEILPTLSYLFEKASGKTSLKEMNEYLHDTPLNLAWKKETAI